MGNEFAFPSLDEPTNPNFDINIELPKRISSLVDTLKEIYEITLTHPSNELASRFQTLYSQLSSASKMEMSEKKVGVIYSLAMPIGELLLDAQDLAKQSSTNTLDTNFANLDEEFSYFGL